MKMHRYKKVTLTLLPETILALRDLARFKEISISAIARILLSEGSRHLLKEWEIR